MTSDINGIVVAIQGNAVSNESLTTSQDGYVLTWDNTDGYWVARPTMQSATGLRQAYFTSSGTWTAPAGVTNVLIIGVGGGGGGGGGSVTSAGGGGGGGAIQQTSYVSVTPGVNYIITIGIGGSGGNGGTMSLAETNGVDGAASTLKNGSTVLFSANGGGCGSKSGYGGLCFSTNETYFSVTDTNSFFPTIAAGGTAGSSINGLPNVLGGFNGGSTGSISGSGIGGGGGGAGPQGIGGNGGNGSSSGNAGSGFSAYSNTAAGGGGGGSAGNGGGNGGAGGNGGSGYLYILY